MAATGRPDLSKLDDALWTLRHAENHLVALRALTAVGRWADEQTGSLVAAAREAGVSWEVIAQALGTTRQAAHRRYR